MSAIASNSHQDDLVHRSTQSATFRRYANLPPLYLVLNTPPPLFQPLFYSLIYFDLISRHVKTAVDTSEKEVKPPKKRRFTIVGVVHIGCLKSAVSLEVVSIGLITATLGQVVLVMGDSDDYEIVNPVSI